MPSPEPIVPTLFSHPASNPPSRPASAFGSLLALAGSPSHEQMRVPKGFSALNLTGTDKAEVGRAFGGLSPDDIVLEKRKGTKLGSTTMMVAGKSA